MDKNQVRRNVNLYKLFVITNEPFFWGPILILSIQQLGQMSLPDIYFMEAAVMFLSVLLNIPCGALADIIGQKKVLILGRIFLLACMIAFAFMKNPLTAWIANILWAIGYSLQSGADQSFFYNNLRNKGIESKFKKIEGCAISWRLLLMAFCSLAVGPLAAHDMRLPLLLCIPTMVIPLVTAFYFKELPTTKKYDAKEHLDLLKEVCRFIMKKSELKWMICFCMIVTITSKIWFFSYSPYFVIVGIDVRYYGLIFFIMNIVAWYFSRYAFKVERHFSERICVIGMVLCISVPIIIMGLLPFWPIAYLVVCQNVVRGFIKPFEGDFINRNIKSDHIRTTVLSINSSASDTVSIFILLLFGFMMKNVNLLHSLTVLGLIVLTLGTVSYRSYRKLFF